MPTKKMINPKTWMLASAAAIVATTPCYAYLDPGTGSIALQAIIGAFAAVAIWWRHIKTAIINAFRKLTGRRAR